MESCPSCGASVGHDDRFCSSCGNSLDAHMVLNLEPLSGAEPTQRARWRGLLGVGGLALALVAVVVGLAAVGGEEEAAPLVEVPEASPTASPSPAPTPTVETAAAVAPAPTPQPLVSLTDSGLAPGRLVLAGPGVIAVYDISTGDRWDPPAGSRSDNSAIYLVGTTVVTVNASGVGDEVRFIDLDTGEIDVWGDPRNLLDRWPVIVAGSTDEAMLAQLIYVQRGSFDWVTIDRETRATTVLDLPTTEPSPQMATLGDALIVGAGSKLVRLLPGPPLVIGQGRIVTSSRGAILTVDCSEALVCVSRSIASDGRIIVEGPVLDLASGANTLSPVLSPDGTMLAVWDDASRSIEVFDVASGQSRFLKTGSLTPGRPVWTLDSRHMLVTDRGQLIVIAADSGQRQVLDLDAKYTQVALIPPAPITE